MWNEIEPDLIWKKEHFFTDSALEKLHNYSLSSLESKTTKSSESLLPLVSSSKFHYQMLGIRNDTFNSVREEIVNNLNHSISPIEAECDGLKKTSQAMIKFFSPGSNYELHTEDFEKFGPWVYVVYLNDETSGHIQFPSEKTIDSLPEKNQEKTNWKQMEQGLRERGTKILYSTKDISIKPQKNLGLLFRVGLAHKVFPLEENKVGRFCVTGWPFAKFD